MNQSNFVQTEGYPLTGERLQELQTTIGPLNSFGNLAGNMTIISGCETVGITVKNGTLFIDGELIEFREASVTPTSRVIIIEEKINRPFRNGTVKEVYTIRYATFGTAVNSWPWSDFKRPVETKEIPVNLETRLTLIEKKLAIFQPGGAVLAWFKPVNQIPHGWAEVQDMRGRTVFGHDPSQSEFNVLGAARGNKNKTLSKSEIPNITVRMRGSNDDNGGEGSLVCTSNRQENAGFDLVINSGGGQAFSILPQYRIAHYIEFIG